MDKENNIAPISYEELVEIEETIAWNWSFNVSIEDTLNGIKRIDLLDYFTEMFKELD